MKKLIDKIGCETFWGGIFGIIAIVAAIISTVLGGIDGSAIWGCIKDVAGTLIAVMVLFVAIKQFFPKKPTDFKHAMEEEIKNILDKYAPLIIHSEKQEHPYRYEIASNAVDAIFKNTPKNFQKLFEFKDNKTITFFVTKTYFVGQSKEEFTKQGEILALLKGKVETIFKDRVKEVQIPKADQLDIIFNSNFSSADDAVWVARVIDSLIYYFVALNTKG